MPAGLRKNNMQYAKKEGGGGAWLKAKELQDGVKAKLVSETKPVESVFEGKSRTQDVAKIRIQGDENVYNVGLNRTTVNGLIDAFGTDSKNWTNQVLTVKIEETRIAGRKVNALYLIADGYEAIDNEDGYLVIVKAGQKETLDTIEIQGDTDVPF